MINQPGVNVGSDVIDKLCRYFACQPGDVMQFVVDQE
jgi:putative transcriptional regulator